MQHCEMHDTKCGTRNEEWTAINYKSGLHVRTYIRILRFEWEITPSAGLLAKKKFFLSRGAKVSARAQCDDPTL